MSAGFMRALDRATAKARHSIAMMVGRCVLTAINDGSKVQTVQLTGLADEVLDRVERFQDYGFTSVPLAEAEGIVVFVGGSRGNGIVIATEDRRYRPTGLEAGEAMIRSEEHTSELQSLMRTPYAVFCLKK